MHTESLRHPVRPWNLCLTVLGWYGYQDIHEIETSIWIIYRTRTFILWIKDYQIKRDNKKRRDTCFWTPYQPYHCTANASTRPRHRQKMCCRPYSHHSWTRQCHKVRYFVHLQWSSIHRLIGNWKSLNYINKIFGICTKCKSVDISKVVQNTHHLQK